MTNVLFWNPAADGETTYYRHRLPEIALNDYTSDVNARSVQVISRQNEAWSEVVVASNLVLRGTHYHWVHNLAGKIRIYSLNHNPWATPTRVDVLARIEKNIAVADRIIVPTWALASQVHEKTGRRFSDIRIVRSAVNPEKVRSAPGDRIAMFGWALDKDDAPGYSMIHRHVRRFYENNPGSRFQVIGHIPPDIDEGQLVHTSNRSMAPVLSEALLCPMVGGAYDKCRSDVRALEAAAAWSVPVVSHTTAYERLTHGRDCLKVRYDNEWGPVLRELALDDDLRTQLSKRANAWVRQYGTIEHTAPQWRDAVQGR